MTTPTMNKMLKVYAESARIERLKCGRPTEGTVRNTLCGVRLFIRWMNERREKQGYECFDMPVDADVAHRESFASDFSPLVSVIKSSLIHRYLSDLLKKKDMRPISAMSYVNQLRQLFSKWVRPYYEDLGWKVPEFPPFGKRPKSPRYSRPAHDQLQRVKTWYQELTSSVSTRAPFTVPNNQHFNGRRNSIPASEVWFATTMMLEFAMRNSDILRLRRDNFIEWEGRVYLNYTPHKTEHSSGRSVKWPVHADIWQRIIGLHGTGGLPALDEDVFRVLNREMRTLGFTGSKGAYELRKICVDHVYQKFGAEMAVSISGDDIKTITHYYADPSQPNIGDVRVLDLL